MIKQLLYKIFRMDIPPECQSCEVLREQLAYANSERKMLMEKLLTPQETKQETPASVEEYKPIRSNHVPWRVRQQMLEAEDREASRLLKQKRAEMNSSTSDKSVEELEKELQINEG